MRIRSLQIRNYKSFLATSEIHFAPGFNVIVGPNNVGKTALVEALALQFGNYPHLSMKTVSIRKLLLDSKSEIDISFELDRDELQTMFGKEIQRFILRLPKESPIENYLSDPFEFLRGLNRVKCSYSPGGQLTLAYLEEIGDLVSEIREYEIRTYYSDGQFKFDCSGTGGFSYDQSLAGVLAGIFKERIYLFRAERLSIGESGMGPGSTLASDASNLPLVLNFLQTKNVTRFQRFNEFVHLVFPEVTQITVPAISNSHARILVWSIDPASERDDLAIPLVQSGTGIGQVLAMLYVVLTSEDPRMIIIDEPQSFYILVLSASFSIFSNNTPNINILLRPTPPL
jgi:hypothetical protein